MINHEIIGDDMQAVILSLGQGDQALHVLEICLGTLRSAAEGHPVEITSRFVPPPPI